jgi:hypothetical protein
MKALWMVPVLGLCMTGCTLLPTAETKPPPNTNLTISATVSKQTVNVDQINDNNAKEMSMALNAELDQAQNGLVIAPEKTPDKPK